MIIDEKIRHEKLQHDINRVAAKLSILPSGKIDRYKYLTVEEILPQKQHLIVEQDKSTNSPLRKALEKQTKTIEKHGEKQMEALTSLETYDKEFINNK